VKDAGL